LLARGDILALKTTRTMTQKQREDVEIELHTAVRNTRLKILIPDPEIELVQLIKFHDKSGDNPGNADKDGDQPLPFDSAEIDHSMCNSR
jgi:hypothetical protein